MRRTIRILFAVGSAISLMLCLALSWLWFEAGVVNFPRGRLIGSTALSGYIMTSDDAFMFYHGPVVRPQPLKAGQFLDRNLPGLRFRTVYVPTRMHFVWVTPALPIGVTALLPATWARAWLRRKLKARAIRKRQGLCSKCGYDLRASPERCPECGTERATLAAVVQEMPTEIGLGKRSVNPDPEMV